MNYSKKLKALVLSLGLAAMMLPANATAQEARPRLFGLPDLFQSKDEDLFLFQDAGTDLGGPIGGPITIGGDITNATAQEARPGRLFGLGDLEGLFQFQDAGTDRGDPKTIEGDISNDGFGENAPLGSGIAILIGAGLGYVALKKKEDEQ